MQYCEPKIPKYLQGIANLTRHTFSVGDTI